MLTCLDDRPARSTKGIRHITIVKSYTLLGDAVQIGGRSNLAQSSTVSRNCLIGMIVGKNKDDVRAFLRGNTAGIVGVLRVDLRRVRDRFVRASETEGKCQDRGKEKVFHAILIKHMLTLYQT